MRSERLPAHYEVVDAELAAVLIVMKEVAEKKDAGKRRVMIMSDCMSALWMIEKAWRAKDRAEYAHGERGSMLEAICTHRERVESAVFVYVPAHRGFAANAYADAAAKAGCKGEEVSNISEVIAGAIKRKRHVNEVMVNGRWEIWDVPQQRAVKEALGWWVVRRKVTTAKEGGNIVDKTRIGPTWETRTASEGKWAGVWGATGAGPTNHPASFGFSFAFAT